MIDFAVKFGSCCLWAPVAQYRKSGHRKTFSRCISTLESETTFPFWVAVPSEKSPLLNPVVVKVDVELKEAVQFLR